MKKLVFDIETVGENYETFDDITKEQITRWMKKDARSEQEFQNGLQDIKNNLGFSPLTGQIVAIGMMEEESGKAIVCYQADGEKTTLKEDSVTYKSMTEQAMLAYFWDIAKGFGEFISFNGMAFDVPYLMIRSAIGKVTPSKNLLSNRYLTSQRFDAKHVDLLDQLTFYGQLKKKSSLHMWTRAFGIKSPKGEGVTGDDVAHLFQEKEYLKIARYNAADLRATRELYEYWNTYLRFQK